MIKYEYKVIKEFGIAKDEKGVEQIVEIGADAKGVSEFRDNCQYFDYFFPSEKLDRCPITHELEEKKYIKLIREIDNTKK